MDFEYPVTISILEKPKLVFLMTTDGLADATQTICFIFVILKVENCLHCFTMFKYGLNSKIQTQSLYMEFMKFVSRTFRL